MDVTGLHFDGSGHYRRNDLGRRDFPDLVLEFDEISEFLLELDQVVSRKRNFHGLQVLQKRSARILPPNLIQGRKRNDVKMDIPSRVLFQAFDVCERIFILRIKQGYPHFLAVFLEKRDAVLPGILLRNASEIFDAHRKDIEVYIRKIVSRRQSRRHLLFRSLFHLLEELSRIAGFLRLQVFDFLI